MTKLKVVELFSGIGSFSKGLKRAGVNFELVGFSDKEHYAIDAFSTIHNVSKELSLGTVENVDGTQFKGIDLITHGSPCFLAGELVNTDNGLIPIEDIEVGMIVRSHDGTYNKVIETMRNNKNNYIFDIKCSATHKINTTFNHPFYIRRDGENQWIEAHELTTDDYMVIPINTKQEEIKWDGCELYYNNHTEISNKLPFDDKRFWYLVGRFIGDGWVTKRKDRNNNISGIKVCCGKHEVDDLKEKIGDILPYTLVEERTVFKFQFPNKELGEFCSQFGFGAINKHIPQNILDLKKDYLLPLYNGLMDSDGNITSKGLHRVTTISKKLTYSIGELVLKLFKTPYFVSKYIRPETAIIEGREVKQKNTYTVSWRLNGTGMRKFNYIEGDILYSRIRTIDSYEELKNVYNIEVENTHSYCVNNIATHNCQDLTRGGSNSGADEGSGTRSSLMWETVRIVEESNPKYVVWEQVPDVKSKKNIHNFNKYIERLDELGYNSYDKRLYAYDFGSAQRRMRLFTVSIRKDIDDHTFNFPQWKKAAKPLKEYIEERMDDTYLIEIKVLDSIVVEKLENNKYKIKNGTKLGYLIAEEFDGIDFGFYSSKTRRGRVQKQSVQTLLTGKSIGTLINDKFYYLTPKEYWLLQEFDLEDFEKVKDLGLTDNQLYSLAGNSINVNVTTALFKQLFNK